ncbi:MAG: iron ABC transporter permease [archaeon]|nr:iron ABC transporter permease [archaeon]
MTESKTQMKEDYSRYTHLKIIFIAICVVATICTFFVSLCVGTLNLSVGEVYEHVLNHITGVHVEGADYEYADNIVWNFRVPRALFAVVAGVALSIAGTVMQSVMKNPLADPYTTGVSSGAMFGVALALTLGISVGGSLLVVNAVIFAMIPIAIIVCMAPFFRRSPASLVLSGIAVSYLFNSLTTLMMVSTDSATLSVVYTWQVGTLSDLNWDVLPLSTGMTLVGLAVLLPLAGKLNIMALEDKEAKALGLDIERLRILCLVVLGLMAAIVISYVGIIGFVGLVIPHMIRMFLGADNKFLLPASAAFGGVFLLGCDIISRAIDVGATIPVGVITSFIGAPIFLYLIIRQKRSMW